MIHNTDIAINKSCQKYDCSIIDYTVAPIFIDENSGGHQWFIEFSKEPENIDLFKEKLDKNLKELNSDYAAKRTKNLILKSPEIILIKNNEFYTWLKQNNRLGGQYKIPRLNNNRKIADEILALL